MKPVSLAQFFQQIGIIMQETEKIGNEMNPYYEKIASAIKKDEEVSKELLSEVAMEFEDGLEAYHKLEAQVRSMRAPAKLMILFQQFQSYYVSYVESCQMMLDAVQPDKGLDMDKFQQSEKMQDDKSQKLAATMTKMMRFIR